MRRFLILISQFFIFNWLLLQLSSPECFRFALGLLRLGFVIDFLSKATLVGFMAGEAIIVSLPQLKGFSG